MKKLYLSLAAAILGVASMSAKELTFYLGSTPIQAGETVEYKLQPGDVEDYGDWAEFSIQPDLKLHADFVGNVEVNVESDFDEVQVCVGTCQTGASINRTTRMNSGETIDLQYHCMGETENGEPVPTVTSKFKAQYVGDNSTIKEFTIVLNPTAGVATITADGLNFRAVKGAVEYTLDAPAAVAVYSITGQKVVSANLNGSGRINLPAGLYIYTVNGKSAKICVR